jgi:hypothetical protein
MFVGEPEVAAQTKKFSLRKILTRRCALDSTGSGWGLFAGFVNKVMDVWVAQNRGNLLYVSESAV